MGRYLQFAMDAVVPSPVPPIAGAAPGAGRAEREDGGAAGDVRFRRRSHAFCSPGSCVCFPWSHEDGVRRSSRASPGGKAAKSFPASCLRCDAGVHLLESTGEGIHVYDFAHRYFESKCLPASAVASASR
ncbi:hypothetical protein JL721_12285 [Aureococcus anophagefferens]|nr:hypothetical protein JL721_12285 [Aureococcus anophagefferens]